MDGSAYFGRPVGMCTGRATSYTVIADRIVDKCYLIRSIMIRRDTLQCCGNRTHITGLPVRACIGGPMRLMSHMVQLFNDTTRYDTHVATITRMIMNWTCLIVVVPTQQQ